MAICVNSSLTHRFWSSAHTPPTGLLFLIPAFGETLLSNGRAIIIRDDEWLTPLTAQGKVPAVAVAVEVEECYLQCAVCKGDHEIETLEARQMAEFTSTAMRGRNVYRPSSNARVRCFQDADFTR